MRNSAGMSGGNSVGISTASGPSSGVSDVVGGVGSTGVGIGVGSNSAKIFFMFILGNGIVISDFLLRIISVVVAMYNGNAASNKIPNTKPGNPRSWARNRRCHIDMSNILNLNRKYNTHHIMPV